jgi:hypothetical protein
MQNRLTLLDTSATKQSWAVNLEFQKFSAMECGIRKHSFIFTALYPRKAEAEKHLFNHWVASGKINALASHGCNGNTKVFLNYIVHVISYIFFPWMS